MLNGLHGPKRREIGGQSRVNELEDPLRLGQVPELVLPQFDQRGPTGKVFDSFRCSLRDEHLASVPGRHQPGDPVHRGTEVVAFSR